MMQANAEYEPVIYEPWATSTCSHLICCSLEVCSSTARHCASVWQHVQHEAMPTQPGWLWRYDWHGCTCQLLCTQLWDGQDLLAALASAHTEWKVPSRHAWLHLGSAPCPPPLPRTARYWGPKLLSFPLVTLWPSPQATGPAAETPVSIFQRNHTQISSNIVHLEEKNAHGSVSLHSPKTHLAKILHPPWNLSKTSTLEKTYSLSRWASLEKISFPDRIHIRFFPLLDFQ